jgi:hypothetical protein
MITSPATYEFMKGKRGLLEYRLKKVLLSAGLRDWRRRCLRITARCCASERKSSLWGWRGE